MCILDKTEISRFVHIIIIIIINIIIIIIIIILFHRPRGYSGYFEIKTSYAYWKCYCACPRPINESEIQAVRGTKGDRRSPWKFK